MMLSAHLSHPAQKGLAHTAGASCTAPLCECCCSVSTRPAAALTHLLTLNFWLRQQPGTGGSSTARNSSSPSIGVVQVRLLTQFQIWVVFICRAQGAVLLAVHLSPSPFQQPDPGPPHHKPLTSCPSPGTLRHAGQECCAAPRLTADAGMGENKPQSLSKAGTKYNTSSISCFLLPGHAGTWYLITAEIQVLIPTPCPENNITRGDSLSLKEKKRTRTEMLVMDTAQTGDYKPSMARTPTACPPCSHQHHRHRELI